MSAFDLPLIVRSLMSVPGSSERFMAKAAGVPADVIAFDLEDSVAPAEKAAARKVVADTVTSFEKHGRLLYVRTNGLDTGLLEEDIAAVAVAALDGVLLPKADDPAIVATVDAYLTYVERTTGRAPGSVRIIALVESAQGVANVEATCRATPRLAGVCLGAEDYSASLGTSRSREGGELTYARGRLVNAARAAGLIAIDAVEADVRDVDHFEAVARTARQLGYRGKFCIHPAQVERANTVFVPSSEEVERARRVVAAFDAGVEAGTGAVALDGAMVDLPVYARARDLLAWHERVGAATGT